MKLSVLRSYKERTRLYRSHCRAEQQSTVLKMNSLLLILFLVTSLVLAEVAFASPALDEISDDEENEIMDVFADEGNLDLTVHLVRIL